MEKRLVCNRPALALVSVRRLLTKVAEITFRCLGSHGV